MNGDTLASSSAVTSPDAEGLLSTPWSQAPFVQFSLRNLISYICNVSDFSNWYVSALVDAICYKRPSPPNEIHRLTR